MEFASMVKNFLRWSSKARRRKWDFMPSFVVKTISLSCQHRRHCKHNKVQQQSGNPSVSNIRTTCAYMHVQRYTSETSLIITLSKTSNFTNLDQPYTIEMDWIFQRTKHIYNCGFPSILVWLHDKYRACSQIAILVWKWFIRCKPWTQMQYCFS